MQESELTYDDLVAETRAEVAAIGCRQLRTPEEVDAWLDSHEGLSVVFFNSLCGCTMASARPALKLALDAESFDVVTVFAGVDKEATERLRDRTAEFPPSSPSFLFVKDGAAVELFERESIKGRQPKDVAEELVERVRNRR